MAAKGQVKWWESVLATLSQWDEQDSTLDQPVDMPAGSFISGKSNERSTVKGQVKSTYRELLERVAGYVLYNFGSTHISEIPNINLEQKTFLKHGGAFDSMDGGIEFHQSFAGYFNDDRLTGLLKTLQHEPPPRSGYNYWFRSSYMLYQIWG